MNSRRKLYAMGLPLGEGATRCSAGRVIYGDGGDSSSQANTTTQATTANMDKRMVVDGGSVGVSVDGHGNSIVLSDFGSVSAALSANTTVTTAAIDANKSNTSLLLKAAEKLYGETQKSLDANISLAGKLAGSAKDAYSDASAQAAGNKNLVLAGIAVVGIVAFIALKGK